MEPINLAALTWGQWIRVALACIAYLGPGMAISIGFAQRKRLDKTQFLVLALGTSCAGWTVLYAWLNLADWSLNAFSMTVISLGAWLYFLARAWLFKPNHPIKKPQMDVTLKSAALWIIIGAVLGIFLWLFKDFVAGLGSDSYHHTLIAQLIYEQGQLPDNYLPYAPLVTFRYHFGYHVMVAVLSTLSGIGPRLMVLISGPILLGLAALSTGYLAEAMSQDRLAAVIAATITGLVAVFPAYMLNWARYTQLAGLVLLPILLGLAWRWISEGFPRRGIPMVSLMAAGLALTHYRVTIMAAIVSAIFILFAVSDAKPSLLKERTSIRNAGSAIILTLLIISPWIVHVWTSYQTGTLLPVLTSTGGVNREFYSLQRLGHTALTYPTNIPLYLIFFSTLLYGCIKLKKEIWSLGSWVVALLVLSRPGFAGTKMDTVSVVISLFVPVSTIISISLVDLVHIKHQRIRRPSTAVLFAIGLLTIQGFVNSPKLIETSAAYVRPSDAESIAWIQKNVPKSAEFIVSTSSFGFTDRFIIGLDAGYWLPLLAERDTITVPMIYTIEQLSDTRTIDRLAEINQLQNHITSNQSINILKDHKLLYLYLGQRQWVMSADQLVESGKFEIVYQKNGSYVLKVIEAVVE